MPSQTDLAADWIGAEAIVSDVRRGGAAEKAGVRAGFEIVSNDGRAAARLASSPSRSAAGARQGWRCPGRARQDVRTAR